MRARRRPLTVVPVTTHSPERDAELLSRLDDGDADARDRRILVGPTFDELCDASRASHDRRVMSVARRLDSIARHGAPRS